MGGAGATAASASRARRHGHHDASQTAQLMPEVHAHTTSEHEHSGLLTGRVLTQLVDLAHGRLIR